MTDSPYRVVVWSTGGIGSIAIRAIERRPNLELVGVWVHSPDKDGKDAGELTNGDPSENAVNVPLIYAGHGAIKTKVSYRSCG